MGSNISEIVSRLREYTADAPRHVTMLIDVGGLRAILDDRERLERAEAEFKNFHRMLCERFGYGHDERDWKRDQVSLMESIASRIAHLEKELVSWSELTKAVQKLRGFSEDWPEHGNAPLAIAAGYSLMLSRIAQLEKELADARRLLTDIKDDTAVQWVNEEITAFLNKDTPHE